MHNYQYNSSGKFFNFLKEKYENTTNNINWTSDWDNISNCFVVAYIYNAKTLVIEHTEKHPIIND